MNRKAAEALASGRYCLFDPQTAKQL